MTDQDASKWGAHTINGLYTEEQKTKEDIRFTRWTGTHDLYALYFYNNSLFNCLTE